MEKITEWSKFDAGIKKELKAKGFKLLGAGVDQQAYLAPDGNILKIFGTQYSTAGNSFSNDHKMFFAWAKFCIKNAANPFLPSFGGYSSFVYNKHTYLQIWQERLYESKFGGEVERIADLFEYKKLTPKMAVRHYKEHCGHLPEANRLMRKVGDQGLLQLATTVHKLFTMSKGAYLFDLHSGNSMARKNGWPVITDPWVHDSNSSSSSNNSWRHESGSW